VLNQDASFPIGDPRAPIVDDVDAFDGVRRRRVDARRVARALDDARWGTIRFGKR